MTQEQPTPETVETPQTERDERAILIGQLIESARARGTMYRLVAIFAGRKPEGQVVGSLAGMINADNAAGDDLVSQGFREIGGYLSNLDTANILDLLVDYGLAIENLPSGVEAAGMELARDYLGSACDSMSLLCEREVEMLMAGNVKAALKLYQVQQVMYGDRLEQRVPGYCDQIEPQVYTAYYKGAMKLVRGFIGEERLYIDDSIAALEELLGEAGKPAEAEEPAEA